MAAVTQAIPLPVCGNADQCQEKVCAYGNCSRERCNEERLGHLRNAKGAQITPVKLAGKNPVVAPQRKPSVQEKKPVATVERAKQVSPGAFCAAADAGAKGIGKKNGQPYICKASSADTRLRWR